MNKFWFEIPIYFFTEIVDIYIYEVCSRIKMGIPYFLCYFNAAQYPFSIFDHI